MDTIRREQLVSRITSGTVRVKTNKTYILTQPSREQVYRSCEIYAETLSEAHSEGLFSDEELENFLYEENYWDAVKEDRLKRLPGLLDDRKADVFSNQFRSHDREVARAELNRLRKEYEKLWEERHAHDHLSAVGAALMARSRYLLACSAGLDEADFWALDTHLLEELSEALTEQRLSEAEYRELARTDPWRTLWIASKHEHTLFGIPPADYTDEQKQIVCWSAFYENAYQNPDCPDDAIVSDDDAFDGWLILEKRKRGGNIREELLGSEKVRNSQEVFIMAQTPEDAKRIDDLNDPVAKARKASRLAFLKQKGEVDELDMPDTQTRLKQALAGVST